MEPPRYRRLRRYEGLGHARFLTFSCYHRLPHLRNDAIKRVFLQRLGFVCREQNVRLLAWVVMPEHVHLLVRPTEKTTIGRFTHALKRPVAEQVLRRWKELKAPVLEKVRHGSGFRIWQTGGGYDRNVQSTADLFEKAEYIHLNPVRRGLIDLATDYAWSSARWYAEMDGVELACDDLPA